MCIAPSIVVLLAVFSVRLGQVLENRMVVGGWSAVYMGTRWLLRLLVPQTARLVSQHTRPACIPQLASPYPNPPLQVTRCVTNVGSDFYTGVTAALITRSGNPAWVPASLKDVSRACCLLAVWPQLLLHVMLAAVLLDNVQCTWVAGSLLSASVLPKPSTCVMRAQVRPEHIAEFFQPLPAERELQLPPAPSHYDSSSSSRPGPAREHSRL